MERLCVYYYWKQKTSQIGSHLKQVVKANACHGHTLQLTIGLSV